MEKRNSAYIGVIVALGIIVAVLSVILLIGIVGGATSKKNVSVTVLESMVESASDLITTKYIYRDLYEYENNQIGDLELPFNVDESYLIYSGTIYVGIDLSEVSFKIDNDDKEIIIELPDLKVISHDLDPHITQKVIKDSIFTSMNFEDDGNVRAELEQIMENKLMEDEEFWDMATRNTKEALVALFANSESTKKYTIRFK